MRVSVVIPSFRNDNSLLLVLKALIPQLDDESEVILVLDSYEVSQKNIETQVKDVNHVIINPKRRLGSSKCRNLGTQRASGEVIILLDDDRIPARGFIQLHQEAHEKKHCVVIGARKNTFLPPELLQEKREAGDTVPPDETWLMKNSKHEGSEAIRRWFLRPQRNPLRWVGFVTGNASVRRRDLNHVAGFDESFKGWGYEDSETGYRLAKEAIPFVKVPEAVNYHLEHPHNTAKIAGEESDNYHFFRSKMAGDWLSQMVLLLIHLRFRILFLLHKQY